MSKKRAKRAYTVEEKLRILEEARQPNTAVAEVLRRHQVDAATFYRWERQAKEGMKEALEGRRRDAKGQEREIERLRAELAKKSRIIAEVVEENLDLKRVLRGISGNGSDNGAPGSHAVGTGGARWHTKRSRRCSGAGRGSASWKSAEKEQLRSAPCPGSC